MKPEHCTPSPADKRRDEIAAAARALVAERGFEGLRTRDIADRVGINIATLHYHVPSKEALIQLLASSMREAFIAQSVARPREGLSGIEQLRLEFGDFRETLETDFELLLAFSELIERARRDEKIKAEIGPMQEYWHGMFERMLAAGKAEGSFRDDIDPALGATMLIGALVAFPRFHGTDLAAFDRYALEIEKAVVKPASGPTANANQSTSSQGQNTMNARSTSSTGATAHHQPGSPEEAEAHPQRWVGLAVLLLAGFMNLIDVTIVNVALPRMQQGLGATSSQIEWVVAAYVLAFALGLLPFGRLGDALGRKSMFLIGVTSFTIFSAVCGSAPTMTTLIIARVFQGLSRRNDDAAGDGHRAAHVSAQ